MARHTHTMVQWIGAILIAVIPLGCGSATGGGASTGVLDRLNTLPDTDADGFVEVPPGEAVAAGPLQLAVEIDNDITRNQAIELARTNLPNFVTDTLSMSATVLVTMHYAGDVTQQLRGARPVGPFDISFEAQCPAQVEVSVSVVADIPVVGRQTVKSFGPFRFTQGTGQNTFQCNTVVRVHSFIGTNGQANATASVEAMTNPGAEDGTDAGGVTGGGTGGSSNDGSTVVGAAGSGRG